MTFYTETRKVNDLLHRNHEISLAWFLLVLLFKELNYANTTPQQANRSHATEVSGIGHVNSDGTGKLFEFP